MAPTVGKRHLTPRPRRRVGQGAQAMTEFGLVAPILFFLFFAILEGGLLLFGVGTARFAAGEMARQESESGNAANADALSVAVVRGTALGTTHDMQVNRIDVYKLNEAGTGVLTRDPFFSNSYALDGSALGPINYPSAGRNVVNGQSDFLGITIYYQYNWKTGVFLSGSPMPLTQSFYIRLEPQSY